MSNLVEVRNLSIKLPREGGGLSEVVKGISFTLGHEKLGIVGESGSGKSLSCRALMDVLPPYATTSADVMTVDGVDLLSASRRTRRLMRGGRMAMILQDPKFSLNPVMRVGAQIAEAIRLGSPSLPRSQVRNKALAMLEAVHIRSPEAILDFYPHQLSGGMGQRVMIAMMVAREPKLLIADEPTSALDVTVQMQVLNVMDELVRERGMGLIFISHDLNLVSRFCDRVLVMYAGSIVETLSARRMQDAKHPYTRGLLNCLPSIDGPLGPLPTLQRGAVWGDIRT